MSNELLFAALDLSGGYKTVEEIGKSLAMSAVTSAVSMAGGAAGAGAGLLGGFAGAALKTGIGVSGGLTGKFLVGGIASGWNWNEMGKQWDDWDDWKGTVIDTAGSAVTNSMETAMLGNTITKDGRISGYTKVTGFNSAQIGQIKTLAGTAGNLTASAMELGINGETTINILNTSELLKNTKFAGASSGLLALTFDNNGAHAAISTAGRNYSITEIANTISGTKAAGIALRTNTYERKNGAGTGTALRSQYGFGDGRAQQQANDILHGRAELIKDGGNVTTDARAKTVFDGVRKIYLTGDNFDGTVESALAMGIALQHEAYRDGITESSAAQKVETMHAIYKHTEMALRMANDGMAGKMMNGVLSYMPELKNDIGNYNRYMFAMARAGGDMSKQREAYEQYAAYVNGAYDSSEDYWKLKLDGTIEAEYDKNGKLIRDLNVEYLDERGNLKIWTEIRDDTGSASRSLARYVGEARARALIGKSFDRLSTYDTQTLKDVFEFTDSEITALRHDPEMKSINFDSLSAEKKEQLIGEALMKKYNMTWQNNKWIENEKFSLSMSDIKDLGQVVIHKNADGSYERFAISGFVDRNPHSYKSVRKQKGVIDYQGLDSITLFKKDLDGNILDRFSTNGWQTVANGYAEDMISDNPQRAYKAEDVYRGATIDINRDFYMRAGNFIHTHYKGPIFVLNRGYQENGSYLDTDGGGNYRNLVHSDYNLKTKKIGISSYGKVSAGCFINDYQTINYIQDYITNKWKISYPYDILMKGR